MDSPPTRIRLTALVIAALASPVLACLWDNDTLRDERRGLPGLAEVLAGRFERHSEFFYRDRIKRMESRLAADPNNLAAYDNLAVAHDKLGDYDAAIEVILRKEKIKPGEYTTHANLGTFYMHKNDLENGIVHIRKAIEINPNAHFGREKYQLQAAEWLQRAKADPSVLDEGSFVTPIVLPSWKREPTTQPAGAYRELIDVARMRRGTHEGPGINEAITGVVGILRFGPGTSPHLYYAMGDLLAVRGDKHLAYRAYKRAQDLNHPRPELVTEAMEQVKGQVEHPSDFTDEVIDAERDDAAKWVAAYQAYEDQLVRGGKDAENEANLAAFYQQHGPATQTQKDPLSLIAYFRKYGGWPLAAVALLLVWLTWRTIKARRRSAVNSAASF